MTTLGCHQQDQRRRRESGGDMTPDRHRSDVESFPAPLYMQLKKAIINKGKGMELYLSLTKALPHQLVATDLVC